MNVNNNFITFLTVFVQGSNDLLFKSSVRELKQENQDYIYNCKIQLEYEVLNFENCEMDLF